MTMQEMAQYLKKHRDSFPEYSDAEIEYVLERWTYESVYPEPVVDIILAKEPVVDLEFFRIFWIDPGTDFPETEEMNDHMAKKERHVAHRKIKKQMYAERMARKAQKRGV